MRGGECLSDLINPAGPNDWPKLLSTYETEMKERLTAWQELISKFYNGEMMAAYSTGLRYKLKFGAAMKLINGHFDKNFAGMCCGAYTERRYSRSLLNFLCKNPRGFDPADFALK